MEVDTLPIAPFPVQTEVSQDESPVFLLTSTHGCSNGMPVFQGFILETRLDSLIPLINKDF